MEKRSVVLVILDGWGIGSDDFTNPIHVANPQNINYLKQNFPSAALQASGIAVGLPWGEEGNSEVGHLNMGAGKIIYQNYPRISLAIRNGDFFKNETLKKAFEHAKTNNSSVNLIGLLTNANVHASIEHLEGIITFAEKENFPKERLNLHLITDGRDSPPKSAVELINRLPDIKQLASIGGRFYAMDRDKHWDRVQKGYDVMTGNGISTNDPIAHIKSAYEKNLSDEYIPPISIGPENKSIKENDSVIFFNFREDRMKQIVKSFIQKNFNLFPTKKFTNLYVATMINYDDTFKTNVIFLPEEISTCLSKVLSDSGKIQWRVAETEKYAHITYFFNGQKELPFPNEYRVLMPSQIGFKYDEHPEMRAEEITQRLVEAIEEKTYDFILTNYANGDIIAHTGNFQATVEAIKIVDDQIGKIRKSVLDNNAILIITSDHGNAERLVNPETGEPETKHDVSPVPIYLVANEFKKTVMPAQIRASERNPIGVLADLTPTILELMKIKKPVEMTGQSLMDYLV
jgi:2,3-bisphosphoglycerate-independent phosphoglycerate mutase